MPPAYFTSTSTSTPSSSTTADTFGPPAEMEADEGDDLRKTNGLELVVGDGEDDEDEDEELDDDARLLEVCLEGDVEDLVGLLEEMANRGETLSEEMLNYPDQSGRTPASHLCANGMIEMLELLEDIPMIDFNSCDSEGNTPLHYAAQAGHVEVVSFLLNKIRTIRIDPVNDLGFTPLMKAALQGRIKCSKLLLFSGASPDRRDYGRGFTASQWARFCGRLLCAEAIDKFVRTAAPGSSGDTHTPGAASSTSSTASSGTATSGGGSLAARKLKRNLSAGSKDKDKFSRKPSWISRKLKKVFSTGSTGSARDSSSATGDLGSPVGAGGGGGIGGGKAEKKYNKAKFSIPQVQVTKEDNLPDTDFGGEDNGDNDSDDLDDSPSSSKSKGKKGIRAWL